MSEVLNDNVPKYLFIQRLSLTLSIKVASSVVAGEGKESAGSSSSLTPGVTVIFDDDSPLHNHIAKALERALRCPRGLI